MSTLIPCPTCFAWVQQKSLGRYNTQKHPTLGGHDSPQTSLRSSNNIRSVRDDSRLDGGTEGDFEEEMARVEEDEAEMMEVDVENPASVAAEDVLRHETFMNAGSLSF